MTVPTNNALVTWRFSLTGSGTGPEIAQFGVWGESTEDIPVTGDQWDDWLTALATEAVSAFRTHAPDTILSAHLHFQSVLAQHFNADGTVAQEQVAVVSPGWVGDGGNALPWQIAQVVSLYSYTPGTFIPNARRRRGRIYIPGLGTNILASDGSGLADLTKATEVLTSFRQMLKQLNSAPYAGLGTFVPGVFSRVASHIYAVTDMTTDVRLDTQRRRANAITVGRVSQTFPGA